MKVHELIQHLTELNTPDLDIYVYADHGQQTSFAHCVGVSKGIDEDGEIRCLHPEDEANYDPDDLISIVEIS